MKDPKIITVDEAMRDVNALIQYFRNNADRMPGSASDTAKQMRTYAEALTMARDAMQAKYYGASS